MNACLRGSIIICRYSMFISENFELPTIKRQYIRRYRSEGDTIFGLQRYAERRKDRNPVWSLIVAG